MSNVDLSGYFTYNTISLRIAITILPLLTCSMDFHQNEGKDSSFVMGNGVLVLSTEPLQWQTLGSGYDSPRSRVLGAEDTNTRDEAITIGKGYI